MNAPVVRQTFTCSMQLDVEYLRTYCDYCKYFGSNRIRQPAIQLLCCGGACVLVFVACLGVFCCIFIVHLKRHIYNDMKIVQGCFFGLVG